MRETSASPPPETKQPFLALALHDGLLSASIRTNIAGLPVAPRRWPEHCCK